MSSKVATAFPAGGTVPAFKSLEADFYRNLIFTLFLWRKLALLKILPQRKQGMSTTMGEIGCLGSPCSSLLQCSV